MTPATVSHVGNVRQFDSALAYDFTACIFTASIPRALRIAKHLDAGNVNINTSQVFGPNVPFGGAKQSGIGREGGRAGLMNYVEAKTISIK